jgi:nicotinamidase-related amidase
MKALIIIDVQNDYFEGGACQLVNPMQTSLNIKKLLEQFREKNLPIIHIQHFSIREGATFFVPDSFGVQIHENVKPIKDEIVIEKNYPNSFIETNLEEVLDSLNIKELVVCGMMSHMCVDSTVRAAFDKGYKCEVVYDACTTKDLNINDQIVKAQDVHNSFMAGLNYLFAEVKKTDSLII